MRVYRCDPVSHRSSVVLVRRADGCTEERVDIPVYDEAPWRAEFRRLRVAGRLSLRHVAEAFGMAVVELSGIENGGYDFVAEADRTAAFDRLRKLAGGGR